MSGFIVTVASLLPFCCAVVNLWYNVDPTRTATASIRITGTSSRSLLLRL